ncbi:universal stress protein [Alkalicoccus daliensis]|uniref:Two-component system, OmpR family, sensor histidine kinase KdpD n=1 Tax=Alkalicoccus daliensis TaxID=745820 RepID=A0A1H0KNQ1_9BACI|nr:universal stress protein [Alkalicoccus daliensis]SDO57380.1 two-component system, OmpR family, sensor histidine kinase KdpD [Alkalicoccus daliensis]
MLEKKDNILICVSNYKNAKELIERGEQEKKAFKSECIVLHVYRPESEEDISREEERDEIQQWADKYRATMIFHPLKSGQRVSEVIGEVARANDVQHIILGQAVRSRWDLLIRGSLVNELFHELDEVDVTIYKVKKSSASSESDYGKGITGYLLKENNTYKMTLDEPGVPAYRGVFYQNLHTDFMTGLLKVNVGEEPFVLRVTEGEVHSHHTENLDEFFK